MSISTTKQNFELLTQQNDKVVAVLNLGVFGIIWYSITWYSPWALSIYKQECMVHNLRQSIKTQTRVMTQKY